MKIENFANDLPLAVGFQQREHVREFMAGPIVELNAGRGYCAFDVNRRDVRLQLRGRSVRIVPFE